MIILLFSILRLAFALSTQTFFSGDDFTVIAQIHLLSWPEMITKYLTIGDPWGFKKITGYLVFRLLFSVFGSRPEPFLFTVFFLHLANSWLIFKIGRLLTRRLAGPLLGALVFNRLFLTYFSNLHEYLVVLFSLLAIYLSLRVKPRLSLLNFVFALLSKEVGIVSLGLLLTSRLPKRSKISLAVTGFLFILWQAPGFISRFGLNSDHPYQANTQILPHLTAYLSPGSIILSIIIFFLSPRSRIWLISAALALLPPLFMANRRESYYLYLPLSYLGIFIAARLPGLKLNTAAVYLAVILIFGGRSFFPVIPKQIYPNWQKYSINQVLDRIITQAPADSFIDLSDLNLERDARLMLGSGVLSDFLSPDITSRYNFSYHADRNAVEVVPISR